jgi:hypothetical protein
MPILHKAEGADTFTAANYSPSPAVITFTYTQGFFGQELAEPDRRKLTPEPEIFLKLREAVCVECYLALRKKCQ